jgi:hypothetical protein
MESLNKLDYFSEITPSNGNTGHTGEQNSQMVSEPGLIEDLKCVSP